MNKGMHGIAFGGSGMRIALLCCAALTSVAFAGPKEYPIEGTVTALGTNQELMGGGSTSVSTILHRTYTVRTPTKVFVLECPYWMNSRNLVLRIHAPKQSNECGGTKRLEVGNTIHFRVEKDRAYLLTDTGKEQKLKILSESMKGEGTPEPGKP